MGPAAAASAGRRRAAGRVQSTRARKREPGHRVDADKEDEEEAPVETVERAALSPPETAPYRTGLFLITALELALRAL